jgi:hypothetical protein
MGLLKKIGIVSNMPEIKLIIEGERRPNWFERNILRIKGLIKYTRTQRANSFVRGFLDCWYASITGGSAQTGCSSAADSDLLDIAGTTYVSSLSTWGNALLSQYGIVTAGIVVGTGTATVLISDYKLGTIIPHGSTGTQLIYNSTTVSAPTTTGATRVFTVSRSMQNASGSDINIKEVGIYMIGFGGHTFCIERTLSNITVINGTSTTLTYVIKITV